MFLFSQLYSLTQKGNVGQLLGMILVLTGMSEEEAKAGAITLETAFGILVYVAAFIASWIGRYRKGDITFFGKRKDI